MGKYTVLDSPAVDRLIDDHLAQIVSAITDQTSPESVILYGSPARGEASVLVAGDGVHMLSDYEIKVVGRSPGLRRLCATLSRQMTARLGISTGIGWMHPRRLHTNQSGNSPLSPGIPSIFMYELKAGGRTLFGQDLLSSSPPIDPDDIPLDSGTSLVLNRMAESLDLLPCSVAAAHIARRDIVLWINKTILACAEALLLSARSYHYSYRERGRRFADIAHRNFAPLVAKVPAMPDLVRRATEFKLRPNFSQYPDDPAKVWVEVVAMVDVVFRYLIKQQHNASFGSYAEFPEVYLGLSRDRQRSETARWRALVTPFSRRMVEAVKYLEQRRWPPSVFLSTHSSSQVVYALVPVLFQSCFSEEQAMMVSAVRQWLGLLGQLEPPSQDRCSEWNQLREFLVWNWRVFCY